MPPSPQPYVAPISDSNTVFKPDIFKGKVLFCTGGGSGICRAMTEALMRHGANAVIAGRTLERLVQASKELSESTGQTCIPAMVDVREPKSLQDAVSKAITTFGRIDFVICGAAGNFLAPISNLSENAFKTVLNIDTIGTFNTIKATLPYVRASKGSYIHVSATLHYNATPYQAHVSAAKAGVDALSAVLAVEEGPHGIRSNVISPGAVGQTAGVDRLSTKSDPRFENRIPLGRIGHVKDVANAAVFLFSDAASYITGRIFVVDGGWEHLRVSQLPYPQAVLDPPSVKNLINFKL